MAVVGESVQGKEYIIVRGYCADVLGKSYCPSMWNCVGSLLVLPIKKKKFKAGGGGGEGGCLL